MVKKKFQCTPYSETCSCEQRASMETWEGVDSTTYRILDSLDHNDPNEAKRENTGALLGRLPDCRDERCAICRPQKR